METPGKVMRTPGPEQIPDLSILPRPAYDLFPMDRYFVAPLNGYEGLATTFSRGCNYQCSFCPDTSHWGGSIRHMSAEQMVDIWGWLRKDYGRRVFYVGDHQSLLRFFLYSDLARPLQHR